MGRLVLINSVLDNHLNYIMSDVKLSEGTICIIDQCRRGFLWVGQKETTDS
jgi:hypothetical protein